MLSYLASVCTVVWLSLDIVTCMHKAMIIPFIFWSLLVFNHFQAYLKLCYWWSTDCCLEVSPHSRWPRCTDHKNGTGLGCLGAIHSKVASNIPCDHGFEKNSWCFYWNCLGWCCLLSSMVYAGWSCKLCFVMLCAIKYNFHFLLIGTCNGNEVYLWLHYQWDLTPDFSYILNNWLYFKFW